jgi:uncharacterized protein YndB with AHSA1/START domain
MGSPEHYRYVEGAKQDTSEGRVTIANTTGESGHYLISCWTRQEGTEPTEEDWAIFGEDEPVLAFVSAPSRVTMFLENQVDIGRNKVFFQIEHGAVTYCLWSKRNQDLHLLTEMKKTRAARAATQDGAILMFLDENGKKTWACPE